MLMPETAMDKNHLATSWEADVRLAGEALSVKSVAVAQMVKQLPGARFGSGVRALVPAHDRRDRRCGGQRRPRNYDHPASSGRRRCSSLMPV